MTEGQEASVRQALKAARRIVVKVGSRSLAALPDLPSVLARQFAELKAEGRSVVLVSSGAVALGAERLGFSGRPTDLGQLQAAASAGQSVLMSRYDDAFLKVGLIPAQVLLTYGDLSNRRRVNNARIALKTLIEAGATPVINENDVVSTEELSFGDNDHLSAMVTPLVDADALVLLTDVSGVLDQAGNPLSYLASFDDFVDRGRTSLVGSGGMASKIGAARKASHAGAAVVIASAFEKGALSQVLAGEKVGTCFPRIPEVLRARKHWIAYVLRPRGEIIVDEGAARALLGNDTSLLPIGVVGLRGDFRRGDSVHIINLQGKVIGLGLTRLSALEVARTAQKKGEDLASSLGGATDAVVIHRDDLVLSV